MLSLLRHPAGRNNALAAYFMQNKSETCLAPTARFGHCGAPNLPSRQKRQAVFSQLRVARTRCVMNLHWH
ncbi:hypothetical protein EOV40_000760 [Acetobacter oryzoeni]|uniref:Uncharacterized protein n=1 Tax=Acetobacter oryzoeni TaxID=2500548 RepID=A0A5B9GFX2_9PROT|nr:hypothetical protein EOV40_000760 [Acetobacter oryzoeni]